MNHSLYIDPIIRAQLLKDNDEVYLKSRFNFLNAHNGLRPGCIHLILGVSSAGKSTLMKVLIKDSVDEKKSVFLWLTEEDKEDVSVTFKDMPDDDKLKLVDVYCEIDPDQQVITEDNFWMYLDDKLNSTYPSSIILDNITTSFLYAEKGSRIQLEVIKKLKQYARKFKIPIVIFAHTRDECSDSMNRLIEINDIRGTKSIINLVEYLYILQRFQINETYFPTIRIKKHRKHSVDNYLFRLVYSKIKNTYTHDMLLTFQDFKKAYSQRNTLDSKKF